MLRLCEPLCVGSMHEEVSLAQVQAWLGERDRVFEHLEKARSMPGLLNAADAAEIESLCPEDFRKDPRFKALMKKLVSTGEEKP